MSNIVSATDICIYQFVLTGADNSLALCFNRVGHKSEDIQCHWR